MGRCYLARNQRPVDDAGRIPVNLQVAGEKVNRKSQLFFGPPLALLTKGETNTMEISGRVNRTAERYLEILRFHGLELNDAERACLIQICGIGFMSPEDIRDLPDEVRFSVFMDPRMDEAAKETLAARLEAASFADLVAMVEALGF
jgi:hypothetical protein